MVDFDLEMERWERQLGGCEFDLGRTEDDDSSLLFVADLGNNRIKVYNKNSKHFLRNITAPFHIGGLFVFNDSVICSDSDAADIKVIDLKSGAQTRTIGFGKGTKPGQMIWPLGVFLFVPPPGSPPSEHMLAVCDYDRHVINVFHFFSGEFSHTIGSYQVLKYPIDIQIWTPQEDPTNPLLFVSDFINNRVAVFDLKSGTFLRSIGRRGTEMGELLGPSGLCIHRPAGCGDNDAVLVVVDMNNNRVQVFGLLSGRAMRVIGGGEGGGVDQMIRPSSVVVHLSVEGITEVVVSDSDNSRLQVYDLSTGVHLHSISYGLSQPRSLFVTHPVEDMSDFVLK